MARDLVLDVVARKNSRDLTTLADDFDRLAKETDDFGNKLNKTTTFSKYLDDELEKTKVKVKELGDEFDRTGNKDVFAQLRGAQSNVSSLERIKKDLTKALDDGIDDAASKKGGFWNRVINLGGSTISNALIPGLQKAGQDAATTFSEGFVGGLGQMALAASPVLAPVAVALVAELLADMGGAVLAGGGFSFIAAGIITQFHDPAVKAAATDLAHGLGSELSEVTKPFREPLAQGLGELKAELSPVIRALSGDFKELAPYVQLFVRSIGEAAQKFLPGFERAIRGSEPVLAVIAKELPTLANGFNIFFDEVSKGSKGGAEGIDTLIKAISLFVAGIGFAIRASENFWDTYVRIADKVFGVLAKATSWIPGVGSIFKDIHGYIDGIAHSADAADVTFDRLGSGMGDVTTQVDDQVQAVDKLKKSWDDWFGISMSLDQANLKLHEGMSALTESIRQNGNHWDLNTKAGQANYGQLLQSIQAARDYRDAQTASGVATDQANAEYQKTIDWLLGVAQKADLSASQINYLRSQVDGLGNALDSLPEDVYVHAHFINSGTDPTTFFHGLAHGGRADVPGYAGGGVFRVGEQGPEYLSLAPGAGPAYVTPNSAINGAANASGGDVQTLRVILQWPDGSVIREQLVNFGRGRGYRTVDQLLPVGSAR